MANKRSYRLNSIGDVCTCLKKTINELRRGEIEIAEARARGYLLNILFSALQDSEMEQKLERLEKKMDDSLGKQNNNMIDLTRL